MKKSVLFSILILLVTINFAAQGQIKRISATRLNAVPTKAEKSAIENAEDVKLDVLHGSSNWYIGPMAGYSLDGEWQFGINGGRRFSDHFRLGLQAAYAMPKALKVDGKSVDVDPVDNHSWIAINPAFDLISSQSGFYKATGLDFSIGLLVGFKYQCDGVNLFEDPETGVYRVADYTTQFRLTYGAEASVSWNCAKHVQLRLGINYLDMPQERKFKNNLDVFLKDVNERDAQIVRAENWQSGQFLVTASVTFHF